MPERGSMAATTRRNHRAKRFGLSQPQSMCKVALPSARVSSQALLNGDTKTETQTRTTTATLLHAIRYYRR